MSSQNNCKITHDSAHGPPEEIAFPVQPKIHSHSQIFRYGQSIFCLPHRPNFSDIFDLCPHWVSVVCDSAQCNVKCKVQHFYEGIFLDFYKDCSSWYKIITNIIMALLSLEQLLRVVFVISSYPFICFCY